MISVVITTYKRPAETVKRAITTVLNQTLKDLEIIVVDDSPSSFEGRKSVQEVVFSFKEQYNVKYIAHENNKGACAARNTGLYAAIGEFIAFLDDDDEWDPTKLEKQYNKFQENGKEVGLVYCSSYLQINDVTGKRTIVYLGNRRGNAFHELMLRNIAGGTSNPMMRTEYAKEVGGFDIEQRAAQDYDLWLRMAKQYDFDYIDEPLIIYHLQPDACISSNPANRISGIERILIKYNDYLLTHPDAYYYGYMDLCRDLARGGMKRKAIKIWFDCVIKRPLKLKRSLRYLLSIIRNGWFPGTRYY